MFHCKGSFIDNTLSALLIDWHHEDDVVDILEQFAQEFNGKTEDGFVIAEIPAENFEGEVSESIFIVISKDDVYETEDRELFKWYPIDKGFYDPAPENTFCICAQKTPYGMRQVDLFDDPTHFMIVPYVEED